MRDRVSGRVFSCRREDDLHRPGKLHRLRRLRAGLPGWRHRPRLSSGGRKEVLDRRQPQARGRNADPRRAPATAARRRRAPARTWTMTESVSDRAAGGFRIAVIGSGPSGFYVTEALLRSGTPLAVDMFER